MDKVQQEHIADYLAKARAKLRVARELVKQHEWDDVVSRSDLSITLSLGGCTDRRERVG